LSSKVFGYACSYRSGLTLIRCHRCHLQQITTLSVRISAVGGRDTLLATMCRTQILIHQSECDVRTLILSPNARTVAEAVVDPLAKPKICRCGYYTRDTETYDLTPCPSHDCCTTETKIFQSSDCICDSLVTYHAYEPSNHPAPFEDCCNKPSREPTGQKDRENQCSSWQPLPILNADVITHAQFPNSLRRGQRSQLPPFSHARSQISRLGRHMYELSVAVSDAYEDYELQAIAERVLLPHEYNRKETVAIMQRWEQAQRCWAGAGLVLQKQFFEAVEALEALALKGLGPMEEVRELKHKMGMK
jgi:hypothetical protein